MTELILIGGSPRSGTTLMQQILSVDPETNHAFAEAKFLGHYLKAFHDSKLKFESENRQFFDSYADFQEKNRQFFDGIFVRLAERHGVKTLNFKYPLLTRYFPEFLELYPQTRCVLMVRDIRDIVVSLLQVGERLLKMNVDTTHKIQNLKQVTAYAHGHYEALYDLLQDEHCREQVLVVHYEQLVSNPEAVLERLRNFTGLALHKFDPTQDWAYYERYHPTEFNQAWISALNGKPISKTSVGQYRRKLTKEQIWLIEKNTRRYFEFFGYQPDFDQGEPV